MRGFLVVTNTLARIRYKRNTNRSLSFLEMPPLALLLFMIMIELLRNEFQREHVVFVCLVVVFLLFGEHDYEDLPRMLETSTKVEVSRVLPSALHTHFNSIELNNEAVYRTIIKNKQYTEALNKCCTQPCTNEVLELKGVIRLF